MSAKQQKAKRAAAVSIKARREQQEFARRTRILLTQLAEFHAVKRARRERQRKIVLQVLGTLTIGVALLVLARVLA